MNEEETKENRNQRTSMEMQRVLNLTEEQHREFNARNVANQLRYRNNLGPRNVE